MMCSFEVEAQLRARGEGLSRRRNLGAYVAPADFRRYALNIIMRLRHLNCTCNSES